MEYISKSLQDTEEFGEKLATELGGGDILCLYGELGAGKTSLVKGLARGLGIRKNVTSPTFALMNIYDINVKNVNKLVHIDTYRLKNEEELVDIGVEDFLGQPDTICVIEWPEKIENLLKGMKTKKIEIMHKNGQRIIKIN